MSQWFEPEKNDIDLSDDKKEMHAFIEQNNQGSVYVSLKVADVIEILSANKLIKKIDE